MHLNNLDFERPILELEEKISSLISLAQKNKQSKMDFYEEINYLRSKNVELIQKIFANLSSWQIVQLARHPKRPYTLDYIQHIFHDFDELYGDRTYADDKAIVGGIARLDSRPVMIIGHQKGRDTKDKVKRNFGMPAPEGYHTPGAYPGMHAEKRGQSRAIAENLSTMSMLKIPIICTVIGEGGSGGALAIGIGDKINMLEYSIYSVISPEGCASILWKNAQKASVAAEAMGITAYKLKKLKLIDTIISEPLGGAHRDILTISFSLKTQLLLDLSALDIFTEVELLNRRYQKLMHYGYC